MILAGRFPARSVANTVYRLPETVRIVPAVVFDRNPLKPECEEKIACARLRLDQYAVKAARRCSLFGGFKKLRSDTFAVLIGRSVDPMQE